MQTIYEPKGKAREYAPLFYLASIVAADKSAFAGAAVILQQLLATSTSALNFLLRITDLSFSPGMMRKKSARAVRFIKLQETAAATTGAHNNRISTTNRTQIDATSMIGFMGCDAWCKRKIFGPVICFVSVYVVYNLAVLQLTAKHALHNKPMLVNIAGNVGLRVGWHLYSDVTMRGNGATHILHT